MPDLDRSTITATTATSPAIDAAEITPDDSNDLVSFTRAIYVGTTGDLSVVMAGAGNVVTHKNVPAGEILPIAVSRINATLTTASDIVIWF